jgi:small conductance mechanosensitive channel
VAQLHIIRIIAPLALACLMAIASAPALADSDAVPTETVETEEAEPQLILDARELIERIDAGRDQVRVLTREMKGAEGDDLVVLEHRLVQEKSALLDAVAELVANYEAQVEAELETTELRAWLVDIVTSLTPQLVSHIERLEERLTNWRRQRDDLDAENALEFEAEMGRRMDWIESLYSAYVQHVAHREILDLPFEKVKADVSKRVLSRAQSLAGRIELIAQRRAADERLSAANADDPKLKAAVQLIEARNRPLLRALGHQADLMDEIGLDSATFRKVMITATGEVSVDLFRAPVAFELLQDLATSAERWATENGRRLGGRLVLFIFILAIFRVLASLTRRLVERSTRRSRGRTQLVEQMMLALAGRSVMMIGILVALSQVGVELAPILTGLGIVGFIVGFALQDSLSNFASGVMILMYQPYDVDDLIEAGGVFGVVGRMSLVSTTIMTIDNQTLIVPNSKIWGDVIKNVTNQPQRRIDLEVRLGYDGNVDRALEILKGILKDNKKVLVDPEPTVKLHRFGESALEIIVRPWVETADYWEVRWDLLENIKRAFDAEGIDFPVPRNDVRLTSETIKNS